MGTIDVLRAQPEENPGRNEFLQSCASCHGVSGKGDGPVAKSLRPAPQRRAGSHVWYEDWRDTVEHNPLA
jgi:mono/diheme cytochrome c family protein